MNQKIFASIGCAAMLSCGAATPGGGSGPGAIEKIFGLAAEGNAIAAASVTAKCVPTFGIVKAYSSTTDANGNYSFDIPQGATPCLLQVSFGSAPTTLHSLVLAPGRSNITPVSELVVAAIVKSVPRNYFQAVNADQFFSLSENALTNANRTVREALARLGIDIDPAPLLNESFTPHAGDPLDAKLETLAAALTNYQAPLELLAEEISGNDGFAEGAAPSAEPSFVTSLESPCSVTVGATGVSISDGVRTISGSLLRDSVRGNVLGAGGTAEDRYFRRATEQTSGITKKLVQLSLLYSANGILLRARASENGRVGVVNPPPGNVYLIDCAKTPAGLTKSGLNEFRYPGREQNDVVGVHRLHGTNGENCTLVVSTIGAATFTITPSLQLSFAGTDITTEEYGNPANLRWVWGNPTVQGRTLEVLRIKGNDGTFHTRALVKTREGDSVSTFAECGP